MIRTRLTDLVGCSAPIQQAPMGTVSSPDLAVAVAQAGGIGSINTLAVSRPSLRRYLDEMCDQTDGFLAVSFLTKVSPDHSGCDWATDVILLPSSAKSGLVLVAHTIS